MKIPRCVASNSTHNDMRFRLRLVELLEDFEPYLFSASQVGRPKPASDLFLRAVRSMGVVPERCSLIENSVTGVCAGVKAGMMVFGFTRQTSVRLLQEAGARIFDHMSDLPELFDRGNRV